MWVLKTAKCTLVAIFTILASFVFANDTVIIVKDARMDMLTAKQAQINKRTSMMTSGGQYKGFRIQVSSSNSRDNATAIKTDLMNKFPEHKTYIIFQSPNFKVRIGNFIKREEAEKLRKQLSKYFPKGVYIVEDAIEYYPKDEINF